MADPERSGARPTVRRTDPEGSPSGDGRRRLTRESILDTAIELVDHGGIARLNMRRLGTACGVEAMALYRYVEGREDLLDGIVDRMVDTLHTDHLRHRNDEDCWQDFLVRVAEDVRRVALDHPDLFPLLATRAPDEPWVRSPLRSLRWLETFLDTLISYDFDDEAAAATYRLYTSFLLGHLLGEVTGKVSDDGTVNLAGYANLQRLQQMLSRDRATDEFDDNLGRLLERIELIGPAAQHDSSDVSTASTHRIS